MKTEQILIRISPEELKDLTEAYGKYLASQQDNTYMNRSEFIRNLLKVGIANLAK